MRKWCASLFLGTVTTGALVTSHAAVAAPRSIPVTNGASTTQTPVAALPFGIHLRRDGRYTVDNCDHHKARYCFSKRLLPLGWTPDQPIPPRVREGNSGGGANTPQGMGPTDVLTAYNIPSNASANGKIVAILDSADSNAYSDLSAYRSAYGLPALPQCSGMPTGTSPCFAQVSETGGASSGQDSGQDADSETSLDMDMISAACPDCSILLVEIGDSQGNFSDSDFVTGAQTAASLGAVATSISIGGPEQGQDPTGYTTPGHLVLAASGDFGYDLVDEGSNINTPSYPASAPDILSVGGTMLFSNGGSYDEAVWNDSNFGGGFSTGQNGQDVTTSGCSTEYPTPSWQSAAIAGSGCSHRATADVSAAAAFVAGGQLADIAVYQGGWQSVEGTSASSPMVAGILTRLGLAETISQNLGWVYTNPTGWHDLGSTAYPSDPSGSNTDSPSPSSCGSLCTVGPGWDGPSGVGSPNGAVLASLGGIAPPPPSMDAGTGTSSGTGTGAGSSGGGTGGGNGGGTGGGTGTSPGGGGGGGVGSSVTPGQLGSACANGSECESGVCAEPMTGAAAVCTESCTVSAAGSSCLVGFACTYGYCFASGPSFFTADGGTGGGFADQEAPSSSSGCSASGSDAGSTWAGVFGISLGLFGLVGRRRRSA
jgi:hypothetical protein